MGKPCLRTLLAILLLVSLQSRAFTETAQYKTSKWELLTESHWELIATHTKTGAKTRISVFHFGVNRTGSSLPLTPKPVQKQELAFSISVKILY